MQSSNQNCNTFQSVVGIFLHSCNTPETAIDLLSRLGVSVSSKTISNATHSLSREAERGMKKLGHTLLAGYVYDNLDIDFKRSVSTVEKPQDTLVHLTTGTMLPLHHINLDDLDCADKLWKISPLNPEFKRSNLTPIPDNGLYNIHPEESHASGLTRRQRFNAWKFRYDLVNFGPEYFRRFSKKLGRPEEVEVIPRTKSAQVPLRALDISPSSPLGNADALKAFFRQAGIGDPSDEPEAKVKEINNTVVLVFGDLLTGQHVRSLLESRSVEKTPWRRLQFVVFVMGLFHLKMACADAIWRVFIYPKKSGSDKNSLMGYIQQIRPKETQRIKSKPGFRRMHEVIQHVGIVSRLDIWRLASGKQNGTEYHTLDDFAKSEPDWKSILELSEQIVLDGEKEGPMNRLRMKKPLERDQQHENEHLLQQIFLLYEEMSYSMNNCDIGRVETLFLPWMDIFLGCGKHKYAAEMQRYLENVHFYYPKGLRYVLDS